MPFSYLRCLFCEWLGQIFFPFFCWAVYSLLTHKSSLYKEDICMLSFYFLLFQNDRCFCFIGSHVCKLLCTSFIKVLFTCHTIYPFKVYSSMVFQDSHRLEQLSPQSMLEHFHYFQKKPYPLVVTHPFPHLPHPYATAHLLSVSIDSFWTFPVNGIM